MRGLILSLTNLLSGISVFLAVIIYVLLGNNVTAEYVFVITSFYNILRLSMTVYFPNGISQVAEANVSVKRIQKLLMLGEIKEPKCSPYTDKENQNGASKLNKTPPQEVGIFIQKASAKWTELYQENTLSDINLRVRQSELIAMIGPVGSGKSSLLHVILKELPLLDGCMLVTGSVSYVAQEPWLFGGTIRENILFGQSYDEKRYQEVLQVCALNHDLDNFSNGDLSLVGERGITLSGGQRARINLARAMYKNSDIYLLDDPLAAVDSHVGKQLFEECIIKYLKGKCVILVTNQLHFLRSVDRIILIEGGKIAAEGNYQDIQESDFDFVTLLQAQVEEEFAIKDLKKDVTNLVLFDNSTKLENKESRASGNIQRKVYKSYLTAGGKPYVYALVFLIFITAQASVSGSDYFLGYW